MSHSKAVNLKIDPWVPTSTRANSVICVLGRRGSGKSSIVFSLLYEMRKMYDAVFAFCPTVDVAQKFQKILPDCFVWNETQSEDQLDVMLRTMTEILASGKRRNVLIVSDDCSFEGKFFRSAAVRELCYNGRNCAITWLLTCQGNVDLPNTIRGQIDYVLLCRENVKTVKENLYKRYAGIFESQEYFNRVLKKVTQNYTCLVIDQTKTTSEISECAYFFRSKEFKSLPPFRISRDCYFVMDRVFNLAYRPKENPRAPGAAAKKIIIQEETLSEFA